MRHPQPKTFRCALVSGYAGVAAILAGAVIETAVVVWSGMGVYIVASIVAVVVACLWDSK